MKRLTLELGGHAPAIISADNDRYHLVARRHRYCARAFGSGLLSVPAWHRERLSAELGLTAACPAGSTAKAVGPERR